MKQQELLDLVKKTSIELMNKGEGDGTIAMCYEDDEVVEKFGGMSKTAVIRKVAQIDGAHADAINDALMSSGEYDFPEGRQPIRKAYDEEVAQ